MIHTNLPTVSKPTPVGSIITVKQGPESLEVLAARAVTGSLAEHHNSEKSEGKGAVTVTVAGGSPVPDRWSRSTTASERVGRREEPPWRKTSGASNPSSPHLGKHSPKSSPSRFRPPSSGGRLDQYRPGSTASSPRLRADPKLRLNLPLADLNNRPRVKSPLSPNIMSSAGGATPNGEPSDYFGLGIAVSASANSENVGPRSPLVHSRYAQPRNSRMESPKRIGIEPGRNSTIESADNPQRRSRVTREKREKDKKTMLSKALEKANTAVLLDNASNFAGALEAYKDACALLQHVCDKTSSQEDKLKLENIRVTYTTRIEELLEMEQSPPAEAGEKELPPRPTSNDSEDFAPQLAALRPMSPFQSPTAEVQELEGDTVAELPVTSATPERHRTRDSFLTDAIRQVEGSSPAGGFLGPLWEQSKSPLGIGLSRSREELTSPDAPLPLRSVSPQPPNKSATAASASSQPNTESEKQAHSQVRLVEQSSWLNTLEESDSASETHSVHSASNGEIRRRDLRSGQHEPSSEFDAAFDAAVEAAYEDGYVPDEDATQEPSPTTLTKPQPALQHGFDFNLPEQSVSDAPDSSAGHEMLSDSTYTNPSKQHAPAQIDSKSVEADAGDYTLPATSFEPPENTVLDRRNRAPGPQLKSLKIDPFAASSVRRKASTSSRMTTDSRAEPPGSGDVPNRADVAPWEVVEKRAPSIAGRKGGEPLSAREEACPWEIDTASPEGSRVTRVGSLRRTDPMLPSSASTSTTDPNSPLSKPRTKKSFASLHDAVSVPATMEEQTPETFQSSTFYSRRNDSTSHLSQRSIPHTLGSIPPLPDMTTQGGGYHLFDTTLGRSSEHSASSSPRTSKEYAAPLPFEPCPDSHLLRPFWLLRTVSNAATHPRGGYITNKLFMPHEAWLNRTLKIKNVEEKIAACDLLTAAAERFAIVDTYDADAVLEEMQHFEDVMEKVQATLTKKLGSEVGVTGVNSMFREAEKGEHSPTEPGAKDGANKASSKSYLTGWRKLRGKNAVSTPTSSSSAAGNKPGERTSDTMASVPMTSFSGVEKRTGHRRDALRDAIFEGPHKEYMSSVARLAEAAQAIDQIARQVEDPGLRHSSPTHVGLELSTRHAAEFFGFYICRFVLSDVGIFIDKYVKRSTEWILA